MSVLGGAVSKRAVAVRISGQEYRIRSEADAEYLQRVARCVDVAMDQVRDRTGTVDTLDVAILTSLNLAREVLALRDQTTEQQAAMSSDRLRGLIERVEAALPDALRGEGDTPLLTLPTGDEVDDPAQELLGPMIDGAGQQGARG